MIFATSRLALIPLLYQKGLGTTKSTGLVAQENGNVQHFVCFVFFLVPQWI